MKWNEKFLRYALALQQQLLLGLDRFDPTVDHSKYIVSWRFSPTSGHPFVKIPSPNSWRSNDFPQARTEPVPVLDRRQPRATPITHILEPSPSQIKNAPEGAFFMEAENRLLGQNAGHFQALA